MSSNLSKIKPKLRTNGRVSGNFGKSKVKAGSQLNDIGMGEIGTLPTKRQYFETLVYAVYPRMDAQWRRSMLPQLRSMAATLNAMPELNLTINSYSL